MTKEEKIQEAYGELYNILCPNESGWSKRMLKPEYNEYEDFDIIEVSEYRYSIRPKSLQGIENNNGWIKIESEDDLPKEEYELYFVTGSNTNVHQCIYHIGIKEYWLKTFTHYQPIQKPQPPIY